jgi:uncharacterized protein YgfB (UPF0149 family)
MVAAADDTLPDYATVAAALKRCGLPQGPAEVQGFALGLLLGAVPEPLKLWQQELYSEFDPADVLAGECRTLLDRIFASVFAMRSGVPMPLTLLLPADIVVDAARLRAVRDWCQGFLFGFGLGGAASADRLSQPVRGLIDDIVEFTRLDTENVENTEENQAALIEIEEYLREGAMLMCDELLRGRKSDESD